MLTAFMFDPLPVWIAAAVIATLFAHAALTKFADLALLEQHLSLYGVPQALLPVASRLVPTVEMLAAVLLLTPWRAHGAAVAVALLLAYAIVMGWHRVQGHEIDCGCGGEPLAVSWALVARNAGLAAIALVAAGRVSERAMGTGDFAVVVAAVLLATLLYAAFNQVLRHRAAGRTHPLQRSTSWMH